MKPLQRMPLIGVSADTVIVGGMLRHRVNDGYVRAIAELTDCIPVVIPSLADLLEVDALLDVLDGILLTGAASNVHPDRFGQARDARHEPFDERRDDMTLQLARSAVQRRLPLLGICRGCQELNVALGGTLEAEIQDAPGRLDHRAPPADDWTRCFQPAHPVEVVSDGLLHGLLDSGRFMVNSVHRQSVALLGRGLRVEAYAPDGVIEAIATCGQDAGFALGIQWHPEFEAATNPVSLRVFNAFGEAVRQYQRGRHRTTAHQSEAGRPMPQGVAQVHE